MRERVRHRSRSDNHRSAHGRRSSLLQMCLDAVDARLGADSVPNERVDQKRRSERGQAESQRSGEKNALHEFRESVMRARQDDAVNDYSRLQKSLDRLVVIQD
jgi:hypothetical protein